MTYHQEEGVTMSAAGRPFLVTGFDTFGDHAANPSAQLARILDGEEIEGRPVVGAVLPVSVVRGLPALTEALAQVEPAAVVALGLAAGRNRMAIERVALNVLDFSIPDVDGLRATDVSVVDGGPAAYFTTLPYRRILAAWRDLDVPGYLSNSAGTYLCNAAMYHLLHQAAGRFPAGFIHVPLTPDMVGDRDRPSLELERMALGIRASLGVIGVQLRESVAEFVGSKS